MEYKIKAIVIASKDYKEKDKLVTLYSVEQGKLNVVAKGVKNLNAKLKYCKEIFTFGEYLITESKVNKIITGCEVIENFSSIIKDPDKYLEASYIVAVLNTITQYSEQNVQLFLETVNALKTLSEENLPKNTVASKYLVDILSAIGYKLSLNKCSICGSDFYGKKYLILETGEIVCSACKMMQAIEISDIVFANMRILSNTDYKNLSTLKLKNIDETLSLLNVNLNKKFNTNLQFY